MTDQELREVKTRVEALRRKVNSRLDGIGHGEEHESVTDLLAELDALESRISNIEDRLRDVERVVSAPDRLEWTEMSKDQKVFRVRQKLVELASNQDSTASLHYDDVQMLFNGQPSAGHAYNLMEAAGEANGFSYDRAGGGLDSTDGQKRIRVNLADVNDLAAFHSLNNGVAGERGENHA
jgi:predicted nuclease with TOPRIM domain